MRDSSLRVKLARYIEECCSCEIYTIKCKPENIIPATGYYRSGRMRTNYAWYAQVTISWIPKGMERVTFNKTIASFEPITRLLSTGFATWRSVDSGDLIADWELISFRLEKDGRWGCLMSDEKKIEHKVVVPQGVRIRK